MILDGTADLGATRSGSVVRTASKLVVDGVSKWFRTPRASVHALDNISVQVSEGEVLCLVGPSGCGKPPCSTSLPG